MQRPPRRQKAAARRKRWTIAAFGPAIDTISLFLWQQAFTRIELPEEELSALLKAPANLLACPSGQAGG